MFPDGSFSLDMDYFAFHRSTRRAYSRKFLDLFGPPRSPSDEFFTERSVIPECVGRRPVDVAAQARRNQYYADVAASIQTVTEELVLNMARAVRRNTGSPRLCLAGGVALNSVANWKILREAGVEQLYVQPAAGDSGGAVGAALYAYHSVLGKPRSFVMEHAFWGQQYPDATVREFLDAERIRTSGYQTTVSSTARWKRFRWVR